MDPSLLFCPTIATALTILISGIRVANRSPQCRPLPHCPTRFRKLLRHSLLISNHKATHLTSLQPGTTLLHCPTGVRTPHCRFPRHHLWIRMSTGTTMPLTVLHPGSGTVVCYPRRSSLHCPAVVRTSHCKSTRYYLMTQTTYPGTPDYLPPSGPAPNMS